MLNNAFISSPIHLCFAFNLSIDTGIRKRANVVLIPKEGAKSYPATRLYAYLLEQDILCSGQAGFQPGFNTTQTAALFSMEVLNAQNEGCHTALIFVNFQKAFDTIDHSLLLSKLNAYGIGNMELSWFSSHIAHRSKRVLLDGTQSQYQPITHGVLQGSVLGPILFILFIIDIVRAIGDQSVDFKC